MPKIVHDPERSIIKLSSITFTVTGQVDWIGQRHASGPCMVTKARISCSENNWWEAEMMTATSPHESTITWSNWCHSLKLNHELWGRIPGYGRWGWGGGLLSRSPIVPDFKSAVKVLPRQLTIWGRQAMYGLMWMWCPCSFEPPSSSPRKPRWCSLSVLRGWRESWSCRVPSNVCK